MNNNLTKASKLTPWNKHDKSLKEIGDRFIPEKMYATRFNPRWALELIIENINYKPKFSFVLVPDYEYTYEELCEKYRNAFPFDIFNFDIRGDLPLFYFDGCENPIPTAIGYGRISTVGLPLSDMLSDVYFNDIHHICIKLNYRFKTLSFPAQILFMIFITNNFISMIERLIVRHFPGLNWAYHPALKGYQYTQHYPEITLCPIHVYDSFDERRYLYSDLVDNFTELSVKASADDPYYREYIKELERSGKGLLI